MDSHKVLSRKPHRLKPLAPSSENTGGKEHSPREPRKYLTYMQAPPIPSSHTHDICLTKAPPIGGTSSDSLMAVHDKAPSTHTVRFRSNDQLASADQQWWVISLTRPALSVPLSPSSLFWILFFHLFYFVSALCEY